MLTPTKQLDQKILLVYYQEKEKNAAAVFEYFLTNTPDEIIEISDLLNRHSHITAAERLHQLIPSFQSVGLPQLSVQLQIAEVYISCANYATAKVLIRSFMQELNEYMPAILDEYWKLITNDSVDDLT